MLNVRSNNAVGMWTTPKELPRGLWISGRLIQGKVEICRFSTEHQSRLLHNSRIKDSSLDLFEGTFNKLAVTVKNPIRFQRKFDITVPE